jgi:hypothetical protein
MAPILALLSYFGVNALVGEKPHAAEAGQSYQLAEKPNCRYRSGNCGLKNADFELQFSFERRTNNQLMLKLSSVIPLDGVMLAVVENEDDDTQPVAMRAMGDDGLIWAIDVEASDPENQRLRLVAAANESFYYGDVAMKFTMDKSAN